MGLQACARNAYGQNGKGEIIVMDKIVQAMPLDDYKIQIESSTSVTGIFSMSSPVSKAAPSRRWEIKVILTRCGPPITALPGPTGRISAPIPSFGIYNIRTKKPLDATPVRARSRDAGAWPGLTRAFNMPQLTKHSYQTALHNPQNFF